MKKRYLKVFASLAMMTLFTACTGQMASVGLSSTDKEEECSIMAKKLIKVNQFLETVSTNSRFHLDEAATAVLTPNITNSNNKPRMLKDGEKRKKELLEKQEELGCEPLK